VLRLFEDMREEWKREKGKTDARFWVTLTRDALSGAVGEWSFVCKNALRSARAQTPGEQIPTSRLGGRTTAPSSPRLSTRSVE
jgi:hypothetical protein